MNATANNPAQQGKKGATMPMEENNPDGSRVVAMLEKLMQQQEDLLRRFDRVEKQQAKDKEDILHQMQTYEKQNAQRFDRVEEHLDSTKKQLQKQGQQCAQWKQLFSNL